MMISLLLKDCYQNYFLYLSMLKSPSLYQPSINVIRYQCFIRYIKIGAFLHVMGLLDIALYFITLQLNRSFYKRIFF